MFKNNKDNHEHDASIVAELKDSSIKTQMSGDEYGLLYILGSLILGLSKSNKESTSATLLKVGVAVEAVKELREEDNA